jgi:ACS family glucarate transporter-like MFS transporter
MAGQSLAEVGQSGAGFGRRDETAQDWRDMGGTIMTSRRPTRVRWLVLGVSCLVAAIVYLDRVNIAIAGPLLLKEFGLSEVELGTILSAFAAGYGIFMLPAGWLLQRLGPRLSLTLALLAWAMFTLLTALAGGIGAEFGSALTGFIVIRFLLGVTEAVSLPGLNATTSRWAGNQEIGRFTSIWLGSLQLGAAITPVLVATLMVAYGWRLPFYVLAAASVAVALIWWWLVRDQISQQPWANAAEAALVEAGKGTRGPTPWGAIWRHRTTWFLTLGYAFQGYVASVYIFWMFLYITLVRHVPLVKGAWLATLPPIAQLLMAPLGGFLSDYLFRWIGSKTMARRIVGMGGMLGTAVLVMIGAFTEDTSLAIIILAVGAGLLWLATGMFWSAASDLGGSHSGAVSSIMNFGANVLGFMAPTITPMIGHEFGYAWALVVVAGAAVASGLLWLGVDLEKGITIDPIPANAGLNQVSVTL